MFGLKRFALINLCTLLFCKNIFSSEGMPQFNAETFPSQLFWLVATFAFLYVCMNFLVLPRIRDNIRLRKNKISNDIERAELLKEQIEKTIQEYDIKIMQAKNQAMEITKNAIEKANQDFASQLEAVKKRITLKISKKEEELTEYKKKIQRDIESASVNLASVIVEKVVGKTIGKNDIDSISKEN